MNRELIEYHLRTIYDFPKDGIVFYDITSLLQESECLSELADCIVNHYRDKGITKVACLESRGFILGAIVADRLGAGFVPIRKAGKLPCEVIEESYEKEYGTDTIEIHKDSITEKDVVLIHDDILATGGTAKAAVNLVKNLFPKEIFLNFVIELPSLNGRINIPYDVPIYSVLEK